MKINTKTATVTMGQLETITWEADGTPESFDLRRRIMSTARELSQRLGRQVEIYACARRGGWVAEVVYAD